MSSCPPFSDPCTQLAPWHSRSAYVPPCSYTPLLARRVAELRQDYVEFDKLLREEKQEKELATKAKRPPAASFTKRVNQFGWPAHAQLVVDYAAKLERRRRCARELLRFATELACQQALRDIHDAAEFAAAFEFAPAPSRKTEAVVDK